ncbi:MAG: RuBisCO large subunit C-terminal-like domain-containing protein [Burkholderiaceae bacterium]
MSERLQAVYRLRARAADVDARAHRLAVEQSIEMPPEAVRDERVRAEVIGRVDSIEPVAGLADRFEATLSLAVETVGGEAGQLMNMLFGNCSLQEDVELVDVRLPDSLLRALPGPRFGIEGWRAAVAGQRAEAAGHRAEAPERRVDAPERRVEAPGRRAETSSQRSLTCTALKPQGLPADALARLAYVFARAGIDVIKDDHGLADQRAAPFAERVAAVQRAVDRANREKADSDSPLAGHRSLYAPSLSGGPARLAGQLRLLRDEGVGALLACPMILGVPTFVELVRADAGVPIIAHPALAGAARIAPPVLLGRLFRLFGADATIFPNWGGRFAYSRADCLAVAEAARAPLGGHAAALPVPAGGMSVERVGEMLDAFGPDTMLLIGADLLAAGDAMAERAAAFVSRVHARAATTRVPGRSATAS